MCLMMIGTVCMFNPLSYYEKLISKYEKTIIVTSDEKNPVIEKLKDKKILQFLHQHLKMILMYC